ncbi:hypothetical protein HOLleu_32824 [Holothuria leucospilota]|uniref:Reverse transcriptase domain-containing protein n=1 Tax=Holothuria leucospilota TaxID=206669 RepID=A0A9Q1BJ79_HOLLE|nr:hypothetical protein HOLleu_32824 [Holothuria leucospilota]
MPSNYTGQERRRRFPQEGDWDNINYYSLPHPTQRSTVLTPTYDGSTPWKDFLVQFEIIADLNHWDLYTRAMNMAANLRGPAQSLLADLQEDHRRNYATLTEALKQRFGPENQTELHKALLRTRSRRQGETLPELGQDLKRQVGRAYPDAPTPMQDALAKDYFIDCLQDPDTRWRVFQARPHSLQEAITIAVEMEAFSAAEQKKGASRKLVREIKVTEGNVEESQSTLGPSVKSAKSEKGSKEIAIKGYVNNVAINFIIDTGSDITIMRSDIYNNITGRSKPKLKEPSATVATANGQTLNCMGCGIFSLNIAGKQIEYEVWVAEIEAEGILGTDILGDCNCLIDVRKREATFRELMGADQGEDKLLRSRVKLADNVAEPSESETFKVRTSDLTFRELMLADQETEEYSCSRVKLADNAVVPSNSEAIVKGVLEKKFQGSAIMEMLPEFPQKHSEMLIARAVVDASMTTIPIRVFNLSNTPKTLYKGTSLATCEPIEELYCQMISTEKPLHEVRETTQIMDTDGGLYKNLQDLLERSSGNIDAQEKDQVEQLLIKYQNTFATSSTDIGRTDLVRHSINTGSANPIKQPARRLPPHRREKEQAELTRMLEAKIIQPSSSPWASPIVLVTKKDRSTRFCVDYRRLSNVTLKDSYPIPRIDDSLNALAGACWFSTLDMKSGYWQVEMDPTDKPKTAFITFKGLYEFNVLAFRLCNPQQRLKGLWK